MKICLVSSAVPFIDGGYKSIVNWLADKLIEAGNRVETIWIPQVEDPATLYEQMLAMRLIDLRDSCERVITFRPTSHVINHPNKVIWFIHHIRTFYDLWDTGYNPIPHTPYWQAYRETLIRADTKALLEARLVFANSLTVKDRLKRFNAVDAEVLYPPISKPERFSAKSWGDEIVLICRMEQHKRQHLAIEAMRHVKTPVRLRLCGKSNSDSYIQQLRQQISNHKQGNVILDHRWITEEEKSSHLSSALAAAYVPSDEDSYGYPTIEAAHSRKATVTVNDSGGVTEFVENEHSGLVVEPEPIAVAAAFDRLWNDRALAQRLGRGAYDRIHALNINWSHVIERLLS